MIFLVNARWKHLLHLAVGVLLGVFKQQLPLNRSFRTSCSPPPSFFVPGWLFYRLFTGVRRSFSSFGTHEGLNRRMVEKQRERERGKKKGWRKVVREPTKIFLIMTSREIFSSRFSRGSYVKESHGGNRGDLSMRWK